MKILFNCENCGSMFNGRKAYEATGEVFCPRCGFLVYRDPSLTVYKKGRQKKGLPPLPIINAHEWARKQRLAAYEKQWKEEEKKKEERA